MSEEIDKYDIAKWLQSNEYKVYCDNKRGKRYGFDSFNTKGRQPRPDLIAIKDGLSSLFEVKRIDVRELIDGRFQLIDYMFNSVLKRTRYFINGEEISPSKFLLATKLSIEGKLVDENTIRSLEENGGRHKSILRGELPSKEYEKTFSIVRHQLWAAFDRHRTVKCDIYDGKIGVLLSGILDGSDPVPYSLTKEFHYGQNGWMLQRWEPL